MRFCKFLANWGKNMHFVTNWGKNVHFPPFFHSLSIIFFPQLVIWPYFWNRKIYTPVPKWNGSDRIHNTGSISGKLQERPYLFRIDTTVGDFLQSALPAPEHLAQGVQKPLHRHLPRPGVDLRRTGLPAFKWTQLGNYRTFFYWSINLGLLAPPPGLYQLYTPLD